MKLITLEDDYPVFNPEVRMIKEFRVILERDKGMKGDATGRFKRLSTKELAYIHFSTHYNSEFVTSYAESERQAKIIKHLEMPEGWKPDPTIEIARITYRELITTPSMNMLSESREALYGAEKLLKIYRRKFDEAIQSMDSDITGETPEEQEKNSDRLLAKSNEYYSKIMDISKKMPEALETINKLEERVKKEMEAEKTGKKKEVVNSHEL